MPTPISTNADHFAFQPDSGERLDLYGALLSWSGTTKAGVVEKQIVQRAGAIFQRVGAPPRRWEFRCRYVGPTCRQDYKNVEDTLLYSPEGRLTHPRQGLVFAILEEVSYSESPADDKDTIDFTLRIAENGLRTAPYPKGSALGAKADTVGASVSTYTASSRSAVSMAGTLVSTCARGFQQAVLGSEVGSGTLLDVDSALENLSGSVLALDSYTDMPPLARRSAYLCLSLALQARNSLVTGPALVWYRVDMAQSLSNLMQNLYGSRGFTERTLCERLNRISSARRIPAGSMLLLTDPTVKPLD